MTISVIIPTFNEESALPSTLDHTFQLGFDEIIVADYAALRLTLRAHPMALVRPRLAALATSDPGRGCGRR